MKKKSPLVIVLIVLAVIIVVGLANQGDDKSPNPGNPITTPETSEISATGKSKTPETTTEPVTDGVTSYKSGTYKIGIDMPAGEYLITAEDSFLGMNYMEVAKDSSGSLDSIVTNDTYSNRVFITVRDGQYLEFDGIAVPVEETEPYEPADGVYTDGMYLVGIDIPAGEYKVKLSDGETMAYLEVAKDSSCSLDSIITNDIVTSDMYQTVKKGQYLTLKGVTITVN